MLFCTHYHCVATCWSVHGGNDSCILSRGWCLVQEDVAPMFSPIFRTPKTLKTQLVSSYVLGVAQINQTEIEWENNNAMMHTLLRLEFSHS